ncbi:MAG: NusG domain II-containing protein [Oscillospiraceae bacterium]|nr:NusG domain II-containing protein [Oscillospiraceae bacterium]
MTKTRKLLYLAVGAVLVTAAVLSVIVLRHSDRVLVEIVQDGTVIQTLDLRSAADQEIRIESPDGSSYNIVSVQNGTVAVREAGCPDQTCVHMGALKTDHLPIVCLPNRLIVRFAEES